MNFNVKGKFMKRTARAMMMVLLFSFALSVFLYAGVGTDSALFNDISAEQGIADAANIDTGVVYSDFNFTAPSATRTWTHTESYTGTSFSTSNVSTHCSEGDASHSYGTGTITLKTKDAYSAGILLGVTNIDPGSFIKNTILAYGATVTANVSVYLSKSGDTNNKFFNVFTSASGISTSDCSANDAESVKAYHKNTTTPETVSKTVTLTSSAPIIGIAFGVGWNYQAWWIDRSITISSIKVTYTITMPDIPVTFAKNGNGTISHTGSQTIGDSGIAFTATPNDGYHFNGITKTAYGSGATSTDLAAGSSNYAGASKTYNASNTAPWTTYTANFEANEATIVYHNNGGSGTDVTQDIKYSASGFKLLTNTGDATSTNFSNGSKFFVGWSTDDGADNVVEYDAGYQCSDNIVGSIDLKVKGQHGAEVHLYAVWSTGDFGFWPDWGTGTSLPNGNTYNSGADWGEATNPYIIATQAHLSSLAGIVNGTLTPVNSVKNISTQDASASKATTIDFAGCYFIVMADITSHNTFAPIGSQSKPFKGNFHGGNSKTLTINLSLSGTDYVGLFGYMDAGSLTNVSVTGQIEGKDYVGGLVGYVGGNVTITNSSSDATISGASYVGGLIGLYESTQNLTISDKTRTKSVTGSGSYVGGFVGKTNSEAEKIFKNLSNSGAIKGASRVGGIVGEINHVNGNGSNRFITCSNTGAITGTSYVGGIVGYSRDTWYYGCVNGKSDSIDATKITGTGRRVGGIVGGFDGGTITSSSTSGTYAGSVARNSANYMTVVSSTSEEAIGGIAGYANWISGSVNNSNNYGTVTASNGIKVGGVVGFFAQGAENSRYVIDNCNNSGAVTGKNYVGGVVGHAQTKEFKNCDNTGAVSGADYVGGVVGYTDGITTCEVKNNEGVVTSRPTIYPTLTTCTSTGAVNGANYVGGIVGYNNAPISSSTNSGAVTATGANAGGIAGISYASISESSNTANVSATGNYAGGVAGRILHFVYTDTLSVVNTVESSITDSTSTSGTIGGASYVGGIVGETIGLISDCEFSGTISAQNDYVGGVVGKVSEGASVTDCVANGNVSGVNFVGGHIGLFESTGTLRYNSNVTHTGAITGTFGVGGFVGVLGHIDVSNTANNFAKGTFVAPELTNSGAVTGAGYVGGIFGAIIIGADNTVTITKTTNSGAIKATSHGIVGGVVGFVYVAGTNTSVIGEAFNSGAVKGVSADSSTYYDYVGGILGLSQSTQYYSLAVGKSTNTGNVEGNSNVGGIAGKMQNVYLNGQITNGLDKTQSTVVGHGNNVGGIVGHCYGGKVQADTVVNYMAVSGVSNVGGVIGRHELSGYILTGTTTNNGAVTATGDYVGGVFGYITTSESVNLANITNNGAVTGHVKTAGIAGEIITTSTITLNNLTNKGNISSGTYSYAAGIAGMINGVLTASNLTNGESGTGTITGGDFSAGIIGEMGVSSSGTITNATNYMAITSTGSYVGGIIGIQHHGHLSASTNHGAVTATGVNGSMGGITGRANNTDTSVKGCTNNGAVSGTTGVGGIVGYINDGGSNVEINNVTNNGAITATGNFVGGILGGNASGTTANIHGTLLNKGSVVGGSYVGGIVGQLYASSAISLAWDADVNVTTRLSYDVAVGASGSYEGGVIGWLNANVTITGTIDFLAGNVDGKANPKLNGANQPGVNGSGGAIGGIVGYNAGDITATTKFSGGRVVHRGGTVTENGTTGAFIGGIVGYNANGATISNAERAGNGDTLSLGIQSYVGGIAGYNAGEISECKYSSTASTARAGVGYNVSDVDTDGDNIADTPKETIYARDNVGGIAGFNASTGEIRNCYFGISGYIPVAGVNNVGGIVGNNEGTVQYTYFKGRVQGTSNFGGIIGYNNSTNVSFNYCQDGSRLTLTGDPFDEIGGIAPTASANAGGVVGRNSNTGSVTQSWAFYTSDNVVGSNDVVGRVDANGFLVINLLGETILPMDYISSSDRAKYTSWESILTVGIDGFYFASGITVDQQKFLSIEQWNYSNNSTWTLNGYGQPSAIANNPAHNGSNNVSFGDIEFHWDSPSSANIRIRKADIKLVTLSERDFVYDGTDKSKLAYNLNYSELGLNATNYVNSYKMVMENVVGDTVNCTASGFNCDVHIKVGDVVFGCWRDYTIKITQFDIRHPESHIFYDGIVFGGGAKHPENSNLTEVTSFATNRGVIQYEPEEDRKFYIYRYYNNEWRLLCTVDLAYGEGTQTAVQNPNTTNGIVTVNSNNVVIDIYTKMDEGSSYFTTGNNYTGTLELNYYVVESDYGVLPEGADPSKEWGSAENPYVISHWIHLLRLSEIVNGLSAPINSVNLPQYPAGNMARAHDIKYQAHAGGSSHFVVTANITMPDYITFNPIGGYNGDTSKYFGGVFNGDVGDGANRSATINLGNHLNRAYTLISENINAGGEDVDNLFDNDVNTKYYNGSTELTFTIDLNVARYITGFAWTTANDTATYYTRNPNRFRIWGSNDNSNWEQLIDVSDVSGNWLTSNFTKITSSDFMFDVPGVYRYVKVTVNSSNGLQMSEFNLIPNISMDYTGLFGLVMGNGDGFAEVNDILVTANAITGGNYVGSLIGKAERDVFVEYKTVTNNVLAPATYTNSSNVTGKKYVGGVVGYVGLGCQMYGKFVNGGAVNGTNYVGGVVGQLTAGAGRQGTDVESLNKYDFGTFKDNQNQEHKLIMINSGAVSGASYVGGIIGGTITCPIDGFDGVETVVNPTTFKNTGNIHGNYYVGGFIGDVTDTVAIRLTNTEGTREVNEWSHNGHLDDETTITALSYAGGLFGKLGTGGHQITSVFSTSKVIGSTTSDGLNIGGLVGHMNGGTLTLCFVTTPGSTDILPSTPNRVEGVKFVGGLVGNMAIGTLDNCYAQGFKYSDVTAEKGGVVGAGGVVTIKDTWALYITNNPTYSTVPANSYGKYILAFDGGMNATIDEMLVFAGLMPDSEINTENKHKATGTMAGEITAEKGKISVGITLPESETVTDYSTQVQVVFYDGSGYEEAYKDAFDNANNDTYGNLFIRLDQSSGSIIIAKTPIRFGTITKYVPDSSSQEDIQECLDSWQNAYKKLDSTYGIIVESHPILESNIYKGNYQTTYDFNGNTDGGQVFTSKPLRFEYGRNSEFAPRIIASQADWNAFAAEVRSSNVGYSGHVKLATNAVQVNYNNLAGDINATLDANGAIVGKHFAGTFDGDGYYITVNIDATGQSKNDEIGLFPHAANATFQNLTIKGSITTVGDDVGAFVGIARGDLIFENCTNEANITSTKAGDNNLGAHNIGGLVGTSNVYNIAFIDCVNTGNITASNGNVAASANDSTYGVGGIIGQGASTSKVIVLDSCRNSGNITAVKNVGGMIGFAYTKTIVTNCGNSGTITATNGNNTVVTNSNSNVGGIIGITDENGSIDVFASYNSGNVIGWGNKAGGIMGADCDYTSSSRQSKIYNCYNTGNIYTGGDKGVTTGGEIGASTGVQVGGIFGNGLYVDVAYCYNLGTITCNGIAGERLYWSNRAGGIGGYTQTTSECKISFCYNAGRIIVNDDSTCNNVGAILGHSKDADAVKAVYDSNGKMIGGLYTCYTIQNACHWPSGGNAKQLNFNARTNHDKWEEGYTSYSNDEIQNETAYSGIVVDTIADLTAVMNANGTTMVVNSNDGRTVTDTHSNSDTTFTKTIDLDGDFSARGNVQSLAEMQELSMDMVSYATSGNWSSILSVLNNNYQGYSSLLGGGYVWVYGCLPQLAVFAVDTRNGLAMSSRSFDKDNQGIYEIREAGSEFNPYIVKDGIDLMGINAILQADKGGIAYDFAGEYISFANSTNNLEKDVTAYINLPDTTQFGGSHVNTTYGQTYVTPDSAKCFMFSNGTSLERGKSYHLFEKGAVIADNFVGSLGDQYGNWISKNGGVKLNDQNMIPIGTYRPFAGNLTGALTYDAENNVSSQTEIRGINITFPNAGLFGGVSNGSVKYITLTGTIKASNSGNTATAGIVAKATNNTQIIGVKSGHPDRILSISTTAGTNGYAGGIVGMVDSGASGNRLTIENCVVDNANVYSHKDTVGGVVGYTRGDTATSFVDVKGCRVNKADLSANNKQFIGGIVGRAASSTLENRQDSGSLAIIGCQVGNEAYKTAQDTANVKINGNNALGGVISFADSGTSGNNDCVVSIEDCYIYGDVLIKKLEATNYDNHTVYTAIGGITGVVTENNGFVTFRGDIEFYGTIDVHGFEDIKNIGGVVGYMGTSARMEQSFVEVYGTINASECEDAENIGGFAGISKGACLDGVFAIAPTLDTDTASNVGGFIGLNDGNTYITRTSIIYTSQVEWTEDSDGDEFPDLTELTPVGSGRIVANHNVGGFIGANGQGHELHMGAKEYKGALYGVDGDMAHIILGSSVDGKRYIGGFLGYNAGKVFGLYCEVTNNGDVGTQSMPDSTHATIDCIGGVFGDNSTTGTIDIRTEATFANNGRVGAENYSAAKQEFVGGVIGIVLGRIDNKGRLTNTGSVHGYEYVGGAIGGVVNGTISGQLINGYPPTMPAVSSSYEDSEALATADDVSVAELGDASVEAVVNVGGVIGIVMQKATIKDAVLINYGTVASSGDNYKVSNLGGAIGINYGVIDGSIFRNYGNISAKNFAGGAIGVNDGTIKGSEFINYAGIQFTGDTALGGAVGYITNNYTQHGTGDDYVSYYPDNEALVKLGYVYNNDTRNPSTVTDTYFGYESIDNSTKVVLQATGADRYEFDKVLAQVGTNTSAFVARGGLGGVFGAINSDDMTASGGWSNNTFFIYGDVYGGVGTGSNFTGTVDAVGGVIGAIEVSYISINNMVIYQSNVGGRNYVGGIVGYNDGKNNKEGSGASIDNCYNVYGNVYGQGNAVGGIVGYVNGVSGPGMMSSNNTPQTNASYWIMQYSNEFLQNSDPNNLTTTLNRSWTTFITDAQYENDVDPNEGTADAYLTENNGLTWKEYFLKKAGYELNSENDIGTYTIREVEGVQVKEWNEFLSKEEYDNNTDKEGMLAGAGVSSWKKYFIQLAGYSINAIDEIGNYSGGGTQYNTGTRATGYYYLFASDSASFSAGGITVDHGNATNPLHDPYANNESLNYWLLIVGSAKRAKDTNGAYIDEYASDFVHENVGGAVEKGFIYSTGYASSKNGYYLYVKDQGNATTLNSTTIDGKVRVFASSNASSAGNVMIFYRKVAPRNTLVYNGYERYVSLIDINFAATQPTDGLAPEQIANYYGKYFYTFLDSRSETDSVEGINRATNAGNHHLKANIWSVDSDGKPIILGTVDTTNEASPADEFKWTIRKRVLDVAYESGHIRDSKNNEQEADAFRFDGTYSHYIKFTVSNIAIDVRNTTDNFEVLKSIVKPKYAFNNAGEAVITLSDGNNVNVAIPNVNSTELYIAYAAIGGTSRSSVGNDVQNCYVYTNGNGEYKNANGVILYSITYIAYFKLAGTHKITIDTDGKNHKAPSQKTRSLSVDKRDLHLTVNTSGGGHSLSSPYTFDGGKQWQGVTSIVIDNFIAGSLDDSLKYVDTSKSKGNNGNLTGNGNTHAGNHIVVDEDNNKVTVNFYTNDADSYTAVVELTTEWANSYYFVLPNGHAGALSGGSASEPTTWTANWVINPYDINVTVDNIKGGEFVYDGKIHSFQISSGSDTLKEGVEGAPEYVELSLEIGMTDESGTAIDASVKPCNVGTYNATISAGTSVAGGGTVVKESESLSSGKMSNYNVSYRETTAEITASIVITPCPIEVTWTNSYNNKSKNGYVYDGTKNGPIIGGISVNGVSKTFSNGSAKGVTDNETIHLGVGYQDGVNAGSDLAYTTGFSVTGTNEAGNALASNYTFVGGEGYNADTERVEKSFSRAKAKIHVNVSITGQIPDKVFDNSVAVGKINYDVTLTSSNSDSTGSISNHSLTGVFADANVGTNKEVNLTFKATLNNTSNYVWDNATYYTISGDTNASITARPLTIKVNSSANGDIYKTYDDKVLYATITSVGLGEVSSTGTQMRTGRGITVSGIVTAGLVVTANFHEVDQKNRSAFDAYVNNVYKSGDDYILGGTNNNDTFYKMLRFTLSGEGATNYYISAIIDKGNNTLVTNNNKSATYVDLVDSAEDAIDISIRKASVKVSYGNTAQSYANADNSYNTNWVAVTGQISQTKYRNIASVDVTNGWMEDEDGNPAVYKAYTRIAGRASNGVANEKLGAVLHSTDGKHLCLTLRNQPTLIIGYFVEKEGGYEIGSMAGLLIATEYFKNNYDPENATSYDFDETTVPLIDRNGQPIYNLPESVRAMISAGTITTWAQVFELVPNYSIQGNYEYNDGETTIIITDAALHYSWLQDDVDDTTDEILKEALTTELNSFEIVFDDETGVANYVYWKHKEVTDTRKYDSFVLVDNIDAILTEEDMDMLRSAFGEFGTGWGAGKSHLGNVVFAEVGSVVIFNGPVFDYVTKTTTPEGGGSAVTETTPFNGSFNGDGYVIDHLTIAYSVTDTSHNNVGMFAEVTGKVTGINLRNLNIQVYDSTLTAKTINVGGVAGKYTAPRVDSQMVEGMMTNVTVHGTINVVSTNGTAYLGGVIGYDDTTAMGSYNVVNGAIVVATLRAEASKAVVGGIIGAMNNHGTTTGLKDVVSLSELYAEGTETYANGFVGMGTYVGGTKSDTLQDGNGYAPSNSDGVTSAYMNTIFEINDGNYNRIAGGVDYTTLYNRSTSIYIAGVYPESGQSASKPDRDIYDVISVEKLASNQDKPRESMRLCDIVDVYVLGYELSNTKVGDIDTHRKASTSKYVGNAKGTTDSAIKVSYQQHLNLLRMFNFMNFDLTKDVTMYTGYELPVIDKAFTGSVNANEHTVNVRSAKGMADFVVDDGDTSTHPQFFKHQSENFAWATIDTAQAQG